MSDRNILKILEKCGLKEVAEDLKLKKSLNKKVYKRENQDLSNEKLVYNQIKELYGKACCYYKHLGVLDPQTRASYVKSLKKTKKPNLLLLKFIEIIKLIKEGDYNKIKKDFQDNVYKK